ncbi:MAG: hypothetical protein J6Y17_01555 [Elusimicrobiaceae bacterium]|nr:hypothetical protein [Elusimicrobiaceae bacterium]
MKKLILLLVALVLLVVLVIVYIPFTPSQTAEPRVGADRDAHSCIASAGYTYSAVRGECIRLWEAGTALFPVIQVEEPVLAAYVVQSENGREAEVFLPGFEQGLLMNQAEDADVPTWTANGWTLTYDPDQGWKLFQDGEEVYTSKAQ